ncbi:MAG TPA: acylneuraminate cytidylyltransferase family protein [bacterium]|nr:acylneuraminate cytidylyltransferase family protein [bacterium]
MILGSICARGGSRGVPGKALRMLNGQTLLEIAIVCARGCSELDAVAVSTDDAAIAAAARQHGADVPFIRPASLAEDATPKWEVFRHLVDAWEKRMKQRVELLVDLDVSVPLRCPDDISRCIQVLQSGSAQVVVTAFTPHRNPYFNMVEQRANGFYGIVKPPSEPVHNRHQAPAVYGLSPAVYAIRRTALDEYEHWSRAPMDIVLIPRARAWDIDDEMDLHIVTMLAEKRR